MTQEIVPLTWRQQLTMAYRRGRLVPAIRASLTPYILGSLRALTPPNGIRLSIPESQPVDIEIADRLFTALQIMKTDQATAPSVYRPSQFWEQLLSRYPSTRAEFRVLLADFGTWPEATSLEHGYILPRFNQSLVLRRYAEDILFSRQMNLWRRLHPTELTSDLSYPRFGNQAGSTIDGSFVGLASFDNHDYTSRLYPLLSHFDRPFIGELGAGYGRLAYFLLRRFPRFAYVDFDLPEVLVCAAYYLMCSFSSARVFVYGDGQFTPAVIENHDLIFLPPWEIVKLADLSVDLFLNKNSLGEMPRETAQHHVSQIARASHRFFHLNHERSPQTGNGNGLPANEYEMPGFSLTWKDRDPWNLLYQGGDSDIYAYLYER